MGTTLSVEPGSKLTLGAELILEKGTVAIPGKRARVLNRTKRKDLIVYGNFT